MMALFSGAVMDAERRHRLLLWRFWDDRPRMVFIGLNPSTANELQDDPTIRRLVKFAQDWGYGGLYACNLFSYVTPDPKQLIGQDIIHPGNGSAIDMVFSLSGLVLLGWGDGIDKVPDGDVRADEVYQMVREPMCLGITKGGNPIHPLYQPADAKPIKYARSDQWEK